MCIRDRTGTEVSVTFAGETVHVIGLGFDPVWFGILIVTVVEIGMISPPVGRQASGRTAVAGCAVTALRAGAVTLDRPRQTSRETAPSTFGGHAGRRLRWNLMNYHDRPPTTGTGAADTGYARRLLS